MQRNFYQSVFEFWISDYNFVHEFEKIVNSWIEPIPRRASHFFPEIRLSSFHTSSENWGSESKLDDCLSSSSSSILIGASVGNLPSMPVIEVRDSTSSEQGDCEMRFMLARILAAASSVFGSGRSFDVSREVMELAWCWSKCQRGFDVNTMKINKRKHVSKDTFSSIITLLINIKLSPFVWTKKF